MYIEFWFILTLYVCLIECHYWSCYLKIKASDIFSLKSDRLSLAIQLCLYSTSSVLPFCDTIVVSFVKLNISCYVNIFVQNYFPWHILFKLVLDYETSLFYLSEERKCVCFFFNCKHCWYSWWISNLLSTCVDYQSSFWKKKFKTMFE